RAAAGGRDPGRPLALRGGPSGRHRLDARGHRPVPRQASGGAVDRPARAPGPSPAARAAAGCGPPLPGLRDALRGDPALVRGRLPGSGSHRARRLPGTRGDADARLTHDARSAGVIGMPQKAYKNLDFLSSQEARSVRILTEYLEPRTRFAHYHVRDTVVFFGSARALPPERAAELLVHARQSEDENALRRAESAVLL